ncbi:glycosyltransferase family 2 protein [Pseudoalteromonas translucida]|uniref:glycosyltransferase family 2 protein n=1 Tax=Pseudoalteromonas translucida TaxID=166935 RepID=UPI000B069B7B|nr:glycosyltransferase [Pseudoalteromonas translucida]
MKVTVYITTFNRVELLKRAVNSVLIQSYDNIQIVVADDGSTDGTHNYLKEMECKGLLISTINSSGESKGACYGRNKAISLAEGVFITGLDDDDYFESWRVEKFVHYWNEFKDTTSIAGLFDSMIEITATHKLKTHQSLKVNYRDLRTENLIGNQIFTKTAYMKALGGFAEDMPALQDWEMWIRVAKQYGTFFNINTYSYIVDTTHSWERISDKKASKIKFAFLLLKNKLEPLSFIEKVELTDTLLSYKQVKMNFQSALFLLLGFRMKTFLRRIKWKLIKK